MKAIQFVMFLLLSVLSVGCMSYTNGQINGPIDGDEAKDLRKIDLCAENMRNAAATGVPASCQRSGDEDGRYNESVSVGYGTAMYGNGVLVGGGNSAYEIYGALQAEAGAMARDTRALNAAIHGNAPIVVVPPSGTTTVQAKGGKKNEDLEKKLKALQAEVNGLKKTTKSNEAAIGHVLSED
jgi:hypothetical protein